MSFKLIVAVSKNYGIGINNELPWNISEDLKHFSKTTKGMVIMLLLWDAIRGIVSTVAILKRGII